MAKFKRSSKKYKRSFKKFTRKSRATAAAVSRGNRLNRHRKKRRAITRYKRQLPFFATTFTTTFKYVDCVDLACVLGAPTPYEFRANSCQDPNYNAVGHQPYGWDQVAQYYENAMILGSKIIVKEYYTGTAPTLPGSVVIYRVADSGTFVPPLTHCAVLETKSNARSGLLNVGQSNDMTKYRARSISHTYSPRQQYGKVVNKERLIFQSTTTGVATVPLDKTRWQILFYPHDLTSSGGVKVLVTVLYTCTFFEPNNIPGVS